MDPQIFKCDGVNSLSGGVSVVSLSEVLPEESDQNARKGFINFVVQTDTCIYQPDKHYVISAVASEQQ